MVTADWLLSGSGFFTFEGQSLTVDEERKMVHAAPPALMSFASLQKKFLGIVVVQIQKTVAYFVFLGGFLCNARIAAALPFQETC